MIYPRQDEHGNLIHTDQMVTAAEHLLNQHRIVAVEGGIGDETHSCNNIIALDSVNQDPIKLLINSPGGDLNSALAMYDTLKLIQSPIYTLGRFVASAAVFILASGKKRYLMQHSKVMIHLPWGQMIGDAHDMDIRQQQMNQYRDWTAAVLKECGAKKTKEEIIKDIDREYWMTAPEAIDYGIADAVIMPDDLKEWLNNEAQID